MAKIRAYWLTAISLASLMSLVGTAILPTWIEVSFRVEPDAGNGSTEAIVTLALLTTTVVSGVSAIASWRRLRNRSMPVDE
jgi:hypothetical protein